MDPILDPTERAQGTSLMSIDDTVDNTTIQIRRIYKGPVNRRSLLKPDGNLLKKLARYIPSFWGTGPIEIRVMRRPIDRK
jgi:hypothetical protein